MAGELGLLNSFRSRVAAPLQNYRGNDSVGGRDISLEEFMQTRAVNEAGEPKGLKNAAGEPITMEDLWCDLGLDPSRITLENLLSLSDDTRYLAPEIIRDYIVKGLNADVSHLDLCSSAENVDSLSVTSPWLQFQAERPVATAEAENIAEAAMTWGAKTITLKKKAIGLRITDELRLSVKLPVLQPFLERVGVQLAVGWYKDAVTTLINGDQSDGSDSCGTYYNTTANTIAFADFLRAWVRGRQIAMQWTNMITTEAGANVVLNLDEFKTPLNTGGTAVTLRSRNRIVPQNVEHFISADMTADNYMLFDRRYAMQFLQFRPVLVESERIVSRQIEGTFVSQIGGFSTIDRAARIILQKSASTFAGFPAWTAPLY